MKYLCRLMEIFVLSYFINENRNNFYMKTKLYIYSQSNYLSRTAIEAKILFAVCLSKKQALTGGKSLASKDKCSKKIGAESAVLHFVFFMIIINKMQQSAKIKLLINLPTDRTFENRWSRYKELGKKVPQAYRVYVEETFLPCDAGDARIFSKEEDVYGIDYGFGLDAPKETEQANPQDLFAYRRNYTWNERNLLTKSSDRNFTVHYRYGEDGQRALKYTDEGRSETLYFNNFFTIHIPTQDQNNPQGLRVHKHIFVGNSRLVTAMTHTDNHGDNEEQKAKRYYYHSDHLGSAQFVTDWNGRQYEHIEYTPYGELWIEEVAAGLDKLPFRFTGKELDEETGLYYYGARYLDPKYSRWLSGDPALNDYMAGSSVGEGGIYNHFNFNLYHYANNNPIRYTDPTGMSIDDWQDNGDGTWTVKSEGATLWDVYGADWKEKSGFDRDPRTLQVGETVGNKNSSTLNEYDASMNGQNDSKNLQHNNSISISSSYYFSRWSYVPVEGIGVNGGASFTGSTFLSDKTLSIFASGFLIAQNLVDDYVFFGDATLFVDGNKVGKSYFQSPNYSFISNGYPFITIGDANFDYDFTNAQSVEVDLHFRAGIAVDSGINKWFINYSKYRMRIK